MIGSSFNPDLVRNYKGVLGQEDTKRQVVLGYSAENDGDEEENDDGEDDDDDDEEEVNPDDEVQIVIKPAKSYLDHNVDEDEDGDILTELNVQRKEHLNHHHHQLGGKRSGVNGSDKDGIESGSESAGSQDSSNCMNANLLSKRRKLGLSRMTPTATQKNGSSASVGSSINFTSHLQSSKSLFSDKNILASAGPSSLNASTTSLNSLAPKRSFNAGLYGSMSALSDSRLLNIKSPYYNAPTMFGGASAYSQKPLYAGIKAGGGANKLFRSNTGLPMMRPSSSLSSLSMIGGGSGLNASSGGLERSATGLAGTSAAGGGSPKGTARRVLDLINQLNSPLEEIRKMASGSLLNDSSAKRLPSLVGQRSRFSAERSLSGASSSGIRMNSPKTPYSRVGAAGQQQDKQRSPLTTELQVPSMPQLLQMNKLQRSTEEIRRLAFQSRGGLNQETEYKLPGGESATDRVSKMKVKLNRMAARGGSSSVDGGVGASEKDGGEAVEVPKFPEIKFPDMKEMPKIDIKLPTAAATAPTSVSEDEAKRSKQVSHTPASDKIKGVFNSNGSSFSFNSKLSPVDTATPTARVLSNFSIFTGASTAPAVKASNAVSSPPSAASSPRVGEFQFAAPIALKTDAAAAALSPMKMNFTFSEPTPAAGIESTSPVPAAFGAFKFNPGTAKVKEGFNATPPKAMIESAKGLKKGSVEDALGLAPKSATLAAIPIAFGDKFKPAADTWSCDVCMVRNKAADLKCLACETPKEPVKVSKPLAATPLVMEKPKDDGFKALIAAQRADKWECGDCMLKNEQSALKCICCESPKPGAASATVIKSEPAKINSSNPFAPASGSGGFAFGFKAAAPATTTTNSVPEKTKKTASDEGFGQLVSTQQAKWECSTCMTRNEQSRSKCACCEQAKPGAESEKVPQFSFGAVSNSNKFSFGMPPAKVVEEEKKPVAPVAGGFSFGSKPAAIESSAAPAKFAFGMGATPAKVEAPTEKGEEKKRAEGAVKPAVPSLGGFKFGITSQTTTTTAQPPVAAAESKPPAAKEITPIGGFKFGVSSSAAAPATTVKPAAGGFTFGAPKTLLGSPSTEVKKTEEVSVEEKKKEAVPASTTFAFGSSPANPSAPLFGAAAVKDDAAKKIETVTSPVFGAAVGSTPLFGAMAAKEAASTAAKSINFGSAAQSTATSSPFAFGSAATTTTSESANQPQSLFGSPSAAAAAIKTVAFGSPATTATNEIKSPSEAPKTTTTFAFGSGAMGAKPDAPKVFGSSTSSTFAFGQPSTVVGAAASAPTTSSPFGMVGTEAAKPAAPLFGGMSSGTPSFGASAPVSTFGSGMTSSPFGGAATTAPAKPAESTPSLFGSNSSPFGSNAAPTTGMFGGVTAAQNNVPAFGSSAPTMTGNSFDVKDGPGASPFQFGSAAGAPSITSNNNVSWSRRWDGVRVIVDILLICIAAESIVCVWRSPTAPTAAAATATPREQASIQLQRGNDSEL